MSVVVSAVQIRQKGKPLFLFSLPATKLWENSKINQRVEGRDEGYQRVLSSSRVRAVKTYIERGGLIPGAIVLALSDWDYDETSQELTMRSPDANWVVDGQHRLAGAHQAAADGVDIDLPVVAVVDHDENEQAGLFVTINREAKNVPSSLYYDLLGKGGRQLSASDMADMRLTDIARSLNTESESGRLYNRVVFTRNARKGELSVTNLARVLKPFIQQPNGFLAAYELPVQASVIRNYFEALMNVFGGEGDVDKSIFFTTLGFGAAFRAFQLVFNQTIQRERKVTVAAFTRTLMQAEDFDVAQWRQMGSGSQAEKQAGEDFIEELTKAFKAGSETGTTLIVDDEAGDGGGTI